MKSRALVFCLSAFGLAMVCGCSSSGDSFATTAGNNLEETPALGIAPSDLLSCWVKPDTSTTDSFFQAHTLVCESTAPDGYPLKPYQYSVAFGTADNTRGQQIFASGSNEIGKVGNSSFPLNVDIQMRIAGAAGWGGVGSGNDLVLKRTVSIASLGAASPEKPITLTSPVRLWPVELHVADENAFLSSNYAVPVTPYEVGGNLTASPTSLSVRARATLQATNTLTFIAPSQGPLTLSIDGVSVEIPTPGTYTFANGALTQGAPTQGDADAAAPTCGLAGQSACADGSCAVWFDHVGSDPCFACGDVGQQACLTDLKTATFTCKPGLRMDDNTGNCRAQ